MRVNKFFLLEVWSITTLIIGMACACWPYLRTYPMKMAPESFFYSVGMFFGTVYNSLEYSIPIFIFLFGLYYLLTARFYFSENVVKYVLFIFFLIGAFFGNKIHFPEIWFHPFFIAYSVGAALAFCLFKVYRFEPEYY